MIENDELLFSDDETGKADTEEESAAYNGEKETWKLLIIDDEPEVHAVTKMVLSGFTYKGKGITFLHAYSGSEARMILSMNQDIAVILLDVVMEEADSGLKLVKYMRDELKNRFVRVILRTGQPGQAPEERVIIDYDINDYKEKTELTAQKLITAIVSALRTYGDIRTIEANRAGLEKIIDASADIFELKSMEKFTVGVLTQILSILDLNKNAIYCHSNGFAATNNKGNYLITAATGDFQNFIGKSIQDALKERIYGTIREALERKESRLIDHKRYVGYFETKNGSQNIIYLEGGRELSELDMTLIGIFFSNVSIAFDNIHLNREVEDTQREIIFTLGETIECRSRETGNHVRRVSEYVKLLATKYGLSEDESEIMRLASPLHDLGKLGTPDSVLNKPAKLTAEEFEIIKNHSDLGYEILKSSHRELLQAAAVIAGEHHERWDGKGYPKGLEGEEIHLYGRITAVADVFDALTSNRVYRQAWTLEETLDYFRREKGRQFDPKIVDLLIENVDEFVKIRERYSDEKALASLNPHIKL